MRQATKKPKEKKKMKITNTTKGTKASCEVYFDAMPSKEVREALKASGFRWHNVKKCWYGYTDSATAAAIIEGAKEEAEANANPASVPEKDEKRATAKKSADGRLMVYYNGIKVNGGKLIRCFYSLNNHTDHAECVTIYARDYDDLPRDLLPVENDTDLYTDYFEDDRATLLPGHPLYKYFVYAALKASAKDAQKCLDRDKTDLNGREPWSGHFNAVRANRERWHKEIAAFEAAEDPGQPTAEDFEAINSQKQEAENRKRQAAHEAELKRREDFLNLRNEGRRTITKATTAHPIANPEPYTDGLRFCDYLETLTA